MDGGEDAVIAKRAFFAHRIDKYGINVVNLFSEGKLKKRKEGVKFPLMLARSIYSVL